MKRKLDEHDVPKEVKFWDSAVTFDKLGLDSRLLQAIAREKFSTPTPIQARSIPLAFEGKDILGLFFNVSM
jgi:ATP-dependent RNA helicase DDX56/DBP9